VRWVKTTNDKLMPLDVEANPDGNVTLDERGRATVHGKGATIDGVTYMSHFATCKNWTRRR
jgi:hypothetical protein